MSRHLTLYLPKLRRRHSKPVAVTSVSNETTTVANETTSVSNEREREKTFESAAAAQKTEIDDEYKLRQRRINSKERLDFAGNNNIAKEAIHMLLKHVRIDPDGGILNLVEGQDQKSKVSALEKNKCEKIAAFLCALRSVSNPILMVYASFSLVDRQVFSADGVAHLRNELKRLRLGYIIVETLFIGANILEFSLAIGCILMALYHASMMFYHKANRAPATDTELNAELGNIESDAVLDPRYMYEAEFWFTDLPMLQNVSIFRILAFSHPNLLQKRWRQFSCKNEMSRAILESFFKCKGSYLTDEQFVEEVAKVITQTAPDSVNLNEHWDWDPSSALSKLREARITGMSWTGERYNGEVLDRAWRLDLLLCGERICYGIFVIICFVVGAFEFFHKIVRCTLMLTDQDHHSALSCLMYFGLFLNQAIGMMHVSLLLRSRVERFIFGGSDAVISTEEHYIMRVYLGLLVERIWEFKNLSFLEKLAIMLTLDDDDLQQLVVEESESKAAVSASIRQYMDQHGLSSKVSMALQHAVSE